MMTAIMQCPNAACGRFSHLGDDPLGRIFRCPHCLAKLPCAVEQRSRCRMDRGCRTTPAQNWPIRFPITANLSWDFVDLRMDPQSATEHIAFRE